MVARPCVAAGDIGRTFAEIVKHDPAARAIWVHEHRGVCEIWLLTADIDPEQERGLYAASGRLHDEYPEAWLRVHLINPLHYEDPVDEIIQDVLPRDAASIPLNRQ